MNYCQELPNVELIAWKTACILVEHVEKHKFLKKYKKVKGAVAHGDYFFF